MSFGVMYVVRVVRVVRAYLYLVHVCCACHVGSVRNRYRCIGICMCSVRLIWSTSSACGL